MDATTNTGETRADKRTPKVTRTAEEPTDAENLSPPQTKRKGKSAQARGQGRETDATTHAEEGTLHATGTTDETRDKATTTKLARRRGAAAETAKPDEGEGDRGDVPWYVPNLEDLHLREVYGDWVHGNPGTHLDGGVKEDRMW